MVDGDENEGWGESDRKAMIYMICQSGWVGTLRWGVDKAHGWLIRMPFGCSNVFM